MVLKYLCDIDYPATKGDKEGSDNSLRKLFKNNGQTSIGEIYDADKFTTFVNQQFGEGLCSCDSFNLNKMKKITDDGGLCMVRFCVDVSTGLPSDSGQHAHWCVIKSCTENSLKASHWGCMYDFLPNDLEISNAAIQDTPESYYGKVENEEMHYVQCASATSTKGIDHEPIKGGSIKSIPKSPLSKTLANKMAVIPKP